MRVQVHRGVYEAALALYERFLPLVYEHLESSPFSKIAFTVSGRAAPYLRQAHLRGAHRST